MNDQTEERLKRLRKLGVKNIEFVDGLNMVRVEFFAPSGEAELEKKPREDEKVNAATGLTRSQTQDILGMDE